MNSLTESNITVFTYWVKSNLHSRLESVILRIDLLKRRRIKWVEDPELHSTTLSKTRSGGARMKVLKGAVELQHNSKV